MRRKKSRLKNLFNNIVNIDEGAKRGILIVVLFLLGGLGVLGFLSLGGRFGCWIDTMLMNFLGSVRIILPLTLLLLAYLFLYGDRYEINAVNYFGFLLMLIGFSGFVHLLMERYYTFALGKVLIIQKGGGYLGAFFVNHLVDFTGRVASFLILLAILVTGILLAFNTSLLKIIKKFVILFWPYKKIRDFVGWWRWRRRFIDDSKEEMKVDALDPNNEQSILFIKKDNDKEIIADGENEGNSAGNGKELNELYKELSVRKVRQNKVDLPVDLLNSRVEKPTSGDIKHNQEIIRRTLESFGLLVEMGETNIGPTVTQYTLKPTEGIKLSQITTLHNDLALALAAHPIRIEAPIPGKSLVGVEVPNQKVATVNLREIIESIEFKTRKSNLMLALGKDVSGKAWLADLTRMPHLLIAGSTGSGKTICINAIILSLLYQNTPETLRFIMVDPKRVELPMYNGMNYLITPVITEVKKTVNSLRWAVMEMEKRFELLSQARKRDIQSFNNEMEEKLPYIIIIIDELADLMSSSGQEVEALVIRLAQMARAVGIHLILATQRPSVNVITGLIKANIPARIAFSVASLIDSRTILDNSGAEKLLGRGDMLFMSAEISKPKRLQGAFVSDQEIKRVVSFLKDKNGLPEYNEAILEAGGKSENSFSGGDEDEDEEMMEEAKRIIISANRASTSLLQRRLKIGYSRAARIIDILEERGFVGPADGSKPREIIRD